MTADASSHFSPVGRAAPGLLTARNLAIGALVAVLLLAAGYQAHRWRAGAATPPAPVSTPLPAVVVPAALPVPIGIAAPVPATATLAVEAPSPPTEAADRPADVKTVLGVGHAIGGAEPPIAKTPASVSARLPQRRAESAPPSAPSPSPRQAPRDVAPPPPVGPCTPAVVALGLCAPDAATSP